MVKTEISRGEYVEVDGLRTFFVRKGSGPALFLLHGGAPGAASLVQWRPCIDYFADSGFAVFAFDQPGYGYTDNPPDYSIEYRIGHARSFIDSWGLDQFALVGNSMGAYIAARIAVEEPERVKRLVIVASGGLGPPGSAEAQAIARAHSHELREYTPSLDNMRKLTSGTIFNPERATDELVRERYEMSAGKNFEAQQGRAEAPPLRPLNEELRGIRAKTLVVWGANDRGSTPEKALLVFQAIPGAELHVFDRCGHWPMWDHTDRFNALVRDFLLAPSEAP